MLLYINKFPLLREMSISGKIERGLGNGGYVHETKKDEICFYCRFSGWIYRSLRDMGASVVSGQVCDRNFFNPGNLDFTGVDVFFHRNIPIVFSLSMVVYRSLSNQGVGSEI